MLNFKELTVSDLNKYYEFTNQFDSYSDLNFVSLLSWSAKTYFYLEDSILIVIFDDYYSDDLLITGLCKEDRSFNLLTDLLHLNSSAKYKIDTVPECVVKGCPNEEISKLFKISKDQNDYIYQPSQQIALEGPQFSWNRRKLSLFHRNNEENKIVSRTSAELSTDELSLLGDLWKKWGTPKNLKEVDALNRYLNLCEFFTNQHYFIIEINDEIQAYAFCEIVLGKSKSLVIHFFKSNNSIEGLANYLFFQISEFSFANGVEDINFEQDLGQEGLRNYKQHMRPSIMLNKYCADF